MERVERNGFFVNVIRPIGLLVAFLGIVAVATLGGYQAWLKFSGQMEMQRLELEARVAEANAQRMAAEADRERAEGEAALAAAEGQALRAPAEAAARSVDRQSFVMAWWGMLTPGFVMLLCLLSGIGGGAVGVGAAFALGVWGRGGRQYVIGGQDEAGA